jgi:hypothetical protein
MVELDFAREVCAVKLAAFEFPASPGEGDEEAVLQSRNTARKSGRVQWNR